MEHTLINSLADISIRDFSQCAKGDLHLLIKDEVNPSKVYKNANLLLKLNEKYIELFDRFNSNIENKEYRKSVDFTKKVMTRKAKIENLKLTITMLEVLLSHAHMGYEDLPKLEKMIQDNCNFHNIRFTRNYLKLAKRIGDAITLLTHHISRDNVRFEEINGKDNEVNENEGSVIAYIPYCSLSGINVSENESMELLMHSIKLADKVNKQKKAAAKT